ncbi:MAG: hypothetical protein M1819_007080 [Sarea resinae]|nr:MAG: hypothetical protein M1819_007080 [Sarea resinae]
MGLYKDANINTNQFSDLAWIFYITYLVFEMPTGYLMQRLPTARYLGINVILWGFCVTMNCVCKNFASLVAVRALLGVFESAIAPALILVTSMWYKKKEQPPRVGLWYLGTGTGTIIGALVSFGFQHYTSRSFYSWQIMFLVIGLITMVIGLVVFLFLPNNPMSSRLSHDEKIYAIERLRSNQTGIENKHFKPKQMVECLRDPQTWLLSLITIASNVPNGAVSSYQATIIKGFGYNSKQTALLSIPGGAVSIVSILLATNFAAHYSQRAYSIVVLLLPGILGAALMAFLPDGHKVGKLIGNYLTNCIGASLPLLYSWVAANSNATFSIQKVAGHTKKVTMNAILLMSFCTGNIIGPLTFRKADAPNYIPAKIAIIATSAVAILFTLLLRGVYVLENRRRDGSSRGGGEGSESIGEEVGGDGVRAGDGKASSLVVAAVSAPHPDPSPKPGTDTGTETYPEANPIVSPDGREKQETSREREGESADSGFMDLTDRENGAFRNPLTGRYKTDEKSESPRKAKVAWLGERTSIL